MSTYIILATFFVGFVPEIIFFALMVRQATQQQ